MNNAALLYFRKQLDTAAGGHIYRRRKMRFSRLKMVLNNIFLMLKGFHNLLCHFKNTLLFILSFSRETDILLGYQRQTRTPHAHAFTS